MTPRDPVEVQKELIAHAFGQAQAYTNVVLGMGYAGFFAIWTFLKPELSKAQVFWSALLVSVSLASFILWEVYNAYYRSRSLLSLANTVQNPATFTEAIEQYKRDEHARVVNLRRIWVGAFALTVLPGFGGLLVLIWAFIRSLYSVYAA
jgi:hypothetical protein